MADALSALTDDEEATLNALRSRIELHRVNFSMFDAYYDGTMRIKHLGISIPPKMQRLRTVIGWPRVVVDSIEERLDIEGFRYADGASGSDSDLWDLWQANDLDYESQLAHLDALVYGSAYIAVGAPDDDDDPPIITVETARDLACEWDARSRAVTSALRLWGSGPPQAQHPETMATLYLPNTTIQLTRADNGTGAWIVIDRDDHGLGVVPVVRMTNRGRIANRFGVSEITPELRSITDAACRTLLGMEVAREFFAAPQRYILGASESSFQAADGTPRSAWETYVGRILALEADGDRTPEVGTFAQGSPEAFTKVVDEYAKIITSITGLPSEYLGITTSNPSSADAIRMNTDRLVNKVKRKQRAFAGAWESALRIALMFQGQDVDSPAVRGMEALWRSPEIPTPAATALAILQQTQAGAVPPTSDVVLERLGYSATERRQMAADRKIAEGKSAVQAILDRAGQQQQPPQPSPTPPEDDTSGDGSGSA